ncbi:hypothetical protein BsWGS_24890 [Bradybaena similaris]
MEYSSLTQVVGFIVLVSSVLALDAHSGTGSIVARDTDKVSAVRNKLTRLKNLLALLDNGDEKELQKVAEQKKAHIPPKSAPMSEDMGVEDHRQDGPALPSPPKPQKSVASQQNGKPLVPPNSSIEVLAKALARLKEPDFNSEDSTGDHLGTDNSESESEDPRVMDMMQILKKALMRPQPSKTENNLSKRPAGDASLGLLKNTDSQEVQVKEQGLKVIEARLMHDILLANEMGISVDDLIEDLDNRASKEAKLRNIQEGLDSLNIRK